MCVCVCGGGGGEGKGGGVRGRNTLSIHSLEADPKRYRVLIDQNLSQMIQGALPPPPTPPPPAPPTQL